MNDTMTTQEVPTEESLLLPKGASESFLLFSGFCFVVMAALIFAYGIFGARLTVGLNDACSEAAFKSGKKMERLGNYDAAIQRYRQALTAHFSDPQQQYVCGRSIGDLLLRTQRYAEAVEAYEQLPADAFQSAGALTGLVTALWRNNQLDEARKMGAVWLEMARNEQEQEQIIWANNVLMRVAEELKQPDVALMHGANIVELDPANSAQLIMARILRRQGKDQQALGHLKLLLDKTTDTQLIEAGLKLQKQLQGENPPR
jgi:tetratricopeptide (TPR) repeat protein